MKTFFRNLRDNTVAVWHFCKAAFWIGLLIHIGILLIVYAVKYVVWFINLIW